MTFAAALVRLAVVVAFGYSVRRSLAFRATLEPRIAGFFRRSFDQRPDRGLGFHLDSLARLAELLLEQEPLSLQAHVVVVGSQEIRETFRSRLEQPFAALRGQLPKTGQLMRITP